MRFLITLLILLVAPQLLAQSDQQLTITKAGYFLTVVDAEGLPEYVKLINVIDLTTPSDPAPPTNPNPQPPKLDMELVKDVQSWATDVADPQGSQAIAAVYSTVRKANLEAPWHILNQATNESLSIIENDSDWGTFRKNLSAVLSERAQRGTLDAAVVLMSVQQGLEMSADGSVALPIDTVNKIIDTTKGIIKGNINATK